MKYILCIFALWIGWSSYQPIRGNSTAPSILSMVDYFKRVENMTQGGGAHLKKRALVYGKGINDSLESTSLHGNHTVAYSIWKRVLRRCYDKKYLEKNPTYKGCTVCDEWLYFSNFKKWFEDRSNGYRDGYHLDKDILIKGNKVYSSDTCCFVPPEINTLITKHDATRGSLPIGVTMTTNKNPKYRAVIRMYGKYISIGCYNSAYEAFTAYKSAKEAHVREITEKYYMDDKITQKVYNALMNYRVEITD